MMSYVYFLHQLLSFQLSPDLRLRFVAFLEICLIHLLSLLNVFGCLAFLHQSKSIKNWQSVDIVNQSKTVIFFSRQTTKSIRKGKSLTFNLAKNFC